MCPQPRAFQGFLYLSVSPAASAASALLQKDLKWMTLSSSKDCVGRRGGAGVSKMFKLRHLCLAGPVGIWSKCHWNEAGSNTVRPRPFPSGVLVLIPHSLCAFGSLPMLLLFAPPPTLSSGFPFPRWLFTEPFIETICLMPCLFHTIIKSTCKPSQSPTGFLYFSCLCWA